MNKIHQFMVHPMNPESSARSERLFLLFVRDSGLPYYKRSEVCIQALFFLYVRIIRIIFAQSRVWAMNQAATLI